MKFRQIILSIASLFLISSCGTPSIDDGNHRYVTLCLTDNGFLNGERQGQVGSYYNAVDMLFKIGDELPTNVTNRYANYVFDGWTDGFYKYTTVDWKTPDVLSASWKDKNLAPYKEIELATFEVLDGPGWLGNNDSVIFAWVWGGSDANNIWVETELEKVGNHTTITFEIDEDIKGFNFARCAVGTTTPDWSIRDPENTSQGRIYNKSGDFAVLDGVFTYVSPENTWVPYPGE